jgi:hypothetical protein
MPESKTYSGGCHCGRVRYEVDADLSRVISCNCSICRKHGLLLAFVPAERFALRSGEEALTDYQFNKRKVHHLFCRQCGIESFGKGNMPDGTPMVAINVRCLDDVDLDGLKVVPFDGKSL